MKKLILGVLALTLTVWIVGRTQASAQQSDSQQNQANQNQTNANGNQNMSGSVSSNGKNFTNDKNNKDYKVDNPEALKGHEGQHVAVIVHVDPDTGVLHILQIAVPDQQ
jgi:uncharacterized protein HemX